MFWPLPLIAALAVLNVAGAHGRPVTQPDAPCLQVRGETITAGDLAAANASFAGLDPQLALTPAPMPGARRVFSAAEFVRLARRYHLALGSVHEACFEWPLQVPARRNMAAAMASVLGLDPGSIQIVEQSQFPAPPGALVFPRENLSVAPGSAGVLWMWRGFVRYAKDRNFLVWAKLRIEAPSERVVALATLLPGEPIAASQLKTVSTTDAFSGGIYASSPNQVLGRVPKTRIEASTPIRLADLATPPEIAAGALVEVEVRNGPLRIYSMGRAERSGHVGDTIPLTNPSSSSRFNARVEGKGRVSVTIQTR